MAANEPKTVPPDTAPKSTGNISEVRTKLACYLISTSNQVIHNVIQLIPLSIWILQVPTAASEPKTQKDVSPNIDAPKSEVRT